VFEVPNATTGVSPFKLAYGRNPRGPLAILKEGWTGENDTRAHLTQPVEEAADFADKHSRKAQESYTANYNLRAREKKFVSAD